MAMPDSISIQTAGPPTDHANDFCVSRHSYTQIKEPKFQKRDGDRDHLGIWFDENASQLGYTHRDNQVSEYRDNAVSSMDASYSSDPDVDFGIVDSLTLVEDKNLVKRIFENQDHDYPNKQNSSSSSSRCHRRNGLRRGQPPCILDSFTFAVRTKLG
ncbi:hypothetical protein HJC23_008631 [Cyclotella cryptica]|uniref:Uncharacterized protein n=1 Tax=Cyclotella cryptica TaxID=29204 RepID=A0ABD3NVD8_9STRA